MTRDGCVMFGHVFMFNLLSVPFQQLRPRAFQLLAEGVEMAAPSQARSTQGNGAVDARLTLGARKAFDRKQQVLLCRVNALG
eukprot:7337327-Alexandrium_andersonii.AAC.1